MIRLNPIPNTRCNASALSALAVGLMLIAAAPARADHVEAAFAHHFERVAASHFLLAGELFFGPPVPVVVPVPVPAPVVVYREVVYEAPVVYPVVYERPYYAPVQHVHYAGCGHGGWGQPGRGHGHGKRGHDRWDDHHGHR